MSEEKEVKTVDMAPEGSRKMSDAEQAKARKEYERRKSIELSAYRKDLRANVELKRLQVEELELNIRFYESKVKWLELAPKLEEIEAQEQAILKEKSLQMEALQKKMKETEAAHADKPPKIVVPKQGEARKS